MANWNQDQPAVEFMRQQIGIYFPEVAFHWAAKQNVDPDPDLRGSPRFRETHRSHGVGGYKNRTTESGHPSLHASGRAADIYVKVPSPLLKAIGDELFGRFITNAGALGLEEIIWNRKIWTVTHPTVLPYRGQKTHEDHVHVGFTVRGSQVRSPALPGILQLAKMSVDAMFPN